MKTQTNNCVEEAKGQKTSEWKKFMSDLLQAFIQGLCLCGYLVEPLVGLFALCQCTGPPCLWGSAEQFLVLRWLHPSLQVGQILPTPVVCSFFFSQGLQLLPLRLGVLGLLLVNESCSTEELLCLPSSWQPWWRLQPCCWTVHSRLSAQFSWHDTAQCNCCFQSFSISMVDSVQKNNFWLSRQLVSFSVLLVESPLQSLKVCAGGFHLQSSFLSLLKQSIDQSGFLGPRLVAFLNLKQHLLIHSFSSKCAIEFFPGNLVLALDKSFTHAIGLEPLICRFCVYGRCQLNVLQVFHPLSCRFHCWACSCWTVCTGHLFQIPNPSNQKLCLKLHTWIGWWCSKWLAHLHPLYNHLVNLF